MLARHRREARITALGLSLGMLVACGSKPDPDTKPDDAAEAKAGADDKSDAEAATPAADAAKPGETFAKPTAKPPPPPTGAYLDEKNALFIQRCTAEHPCVKELQAEGEAHCRTYSLGAYGEGWRLPTLEEAKRFAGFDALEDKEGFHWTSTAYQEDAKQAWIVDPKSGQSTTVPRDRKPFTIRCVYEP